MFSSKIFRATRTLLTTLKEPSALRHKCTESASSNFDTCVNLSGKTGKCTKKVALGCRTPNASVKCVSLSKEVPCKRVRPQFSSFLEMLQAQDVFKLRKNCPNECCCLTGFISKKRSKISFTDLKQLETRC